MDRDNEESDLETEQVGSDGLKQLTEWDIRKIIESLANVIGFDMDNSFGFNIEPSTSSYYLKKDPGKRDSLTEIKHVIFPSQMRIGDELLEKVLSLPAFNSLGIDLPVQILYIVPPRTTLLQQTKLRVMAFRKTLAEKCQKKILSFDIVMSSNGEERRKVFEQFASEGEDCFRVIIHDECHWGIGGGGIVDTMINEKRIIEDEKTITVQVSATAWNQLAVMGESKQLQENVVVWKEKDEEDSKAKYCGREQLSEAGRLIPDSEYDDLSQKACQLLRDHKLPEEVYEKLIGDSNQHYRSTILCILRYCQTLEVVLGLAKRRPFFCKETEEAIQKVLLKGKMCLIRLPGLSANCVIPRYFQSFLQDILKRKKKEKQMAVLRITSNDKIFVSKFWYKEIAEAQHRQAPVFQTMNDLEDIPSIVIVIEMIRMGDTLPSHFATFDLRSRYTGGKVHSFAAILQDAGRAFSWDDDIENRPKVLLSEIAKEVLDDPVQALENKKLARIDPALKPKEANFESVEQLDALFLTESFLNCVPDGVKHFYTKQKETLEKTGALSRRFILSAEPQIGKTGAILHFLDRLIKEITQLGERKSEFHELQKRWNEIEPKVLHNQLREDPKEWIRYHSLNQFWGRGSSNPSSEIATTISSLCSEKVIVADFGCGRDLLLLKNLKELDILKHYYGIDHVIQEEKTEENVTLKSANMESVDLEKKSVDVVVFCLSWLGPRIGPYLKAAKRCLKEGGYLIVWETTKSIQTREASSKLKIEEMLRAFHFTLQDTQKRGFFSRLIARKELASF